LTVSPQCGENQLDEIVVNLEKSAQRLCGQLATANEENESLKHIIRAREETCSTSSPRLLPSRRQQRLDAPLTRFHYLWNEKTADLEKTVQDLTNQFAASQCALRIHQQKHQCETMFADGRIYDAAHHLLEIINSMSEDLQHNELIMNWIEGESLRHFVLMYIYSLLSGFRNQCISHLRAIGDEASSADNHEAFSAYSAILSLTSSPPDTVLMRWAKLGLRCHSTNEVLGDADKVWCGLRGRLE
jgi:hypothetical protein